MIEINLRPPKNREAHYLPFFLAAIFVLWVVGVFFLGYQYFDSKETLREKTTRYEQLQNHKKALEESLQEFNNQKEIPNPLQTIEWIERLRLDLVSLFNELDQRLPVAGKVVNFDLSYPGQMNVTVQFAQMDDASLFLERLKTLKMFTRVQLLSLTRKQDVQKAESDVAELTATQNASYVAAYTLFIEIAKAGELNGNNSD
jgi:hypothetical protein